MATHKWVDMRKRLKHTRYNIRYTINYIFHMFSNAKWWLLYRTICRFHIIKTGLKPGYYDTDTLLEEAMYSLLVKFVEKESGGISGVKNTIKYYADTKIEYDVESNTFLATDAENRKRLYESIEKIYTWYKVDRPALYAKVIEKGICGYQTEEGIFAKDTEMLKILVEIRGTLWT